LLASTFSRITLTRGTHREPFGNPPAEVRNAIFVKATA
jgi:hypothetical protein